MTQLAGGCLCGQIRYVVQGKPCDVTYCHCTHCRRAAGAAAVAWATFPANAVQILAGTVASYRSSLEGERLFCSRCGTQLFFSSSTSAQELDVTLGSLDDSTALKPTCHLWTQSMIGWLRDFSRLPRHPEEPPLSLRDEARIWLPPDWLTRSAADEKT